MKIIRCYRGMILVSCVFIVRENLKTTFLLLKKIFAL